MTTQAVEPGWYLDRDPMYERYWDGNAWAKERRKTRLYTPAFPGPLPGDQTESGHRECPYCFEDIAAKAARCKHCSGELRYCPSCGENVGVTTKQKFVGLLRGGMKVQYRCMQCNRVLDGPRF